MTTDEILIKIKNNRYAYDNLAQDKDIRLLCKYLRFKYNSEELRLVSDKLINYIEQCKKETRLWFANDQ